MASIQALFAACMLQLASAEQPICAQWGVPLDDGNRNSWPPNGGNTTDSLACQVKCQSALFCEHFTWYANTGGCWLQGVDVTEIHNAYAPLAISGPRVCGTVRDIQVEHTSSATRSTSSATWSAQLIVAVVLAILLVVGLLAGVYYWFCRSTKSKKSKREHKIASHSSRDVEDQSPLMSNNALPTANIQQFAPANVVQAAPYVGFVPQAAPVYQQAMTRFDMLDTDHSGGLSREEFARAFK